MKKVNLILMFLVLAALAFSQDAFARRGPGRGGRGSGGWGMNSNYSRMYNPTTVETIKGKVSKVEKITPMKGMYYGVHILVKTDKEELSVHLGPGWFIENQDTKINEGDEVEITGSKVTFQGKPALIAAQLKKGDATLVLRDPNGFPTWSGWRRGSMMGKSMMGPGMMMTPQPAVEQKKTN